MARRRRTVIRYIIYMLGYVEAVFGLDRLMAGSYSTLYSYISDIGNDTLSKIILHRTIV